MNQHISAIYEHGVLKPLEPVNLRDQQVVDIVISGLADNDQSAGELPLVAEVEGAEVTWNEIHELLGKLPTSLTEDFERERDERF